MIVRALATITMLGLWAILAAAVLACERPHSDLGPSKSMTTFRVVKGLGATRIGQESEARNSLTLQLTRSKTFRIVRTTTSGAESVSAACINMKISTQINIDNDLEITHRNTSTKTNMSTNIDIDIINININNLNNRNIETETGIEIEIEIVILILTDTDPNTAKAARVKLPDTLSSITSSSRTQVGST